MDVEALKDAIQFNMSPEAVALMIAHLQDTPCDDNRDAENQVEWFVQQLIEVVGGTEALNHLFEEIGV